MSKSRVLSISNDVHELVGKGFLDLITLKNSKLTRKFGTNSTNLMKLYISVFQKIEFKLRQLTKLMSMQLQNQRVIHLKAKNCMRIFLLKVLLKLLCTMKKWSICKLIMDNFKDRIIIE